MFLDSSDNIHDATDVISDYITFCEDTIIPKKTVKFYPNKPWVSKSFEKIPLNEKEIAFRAKDHLEWKCVQSKLRKEISEAKKQYKEKIKFQFSTGNMCDARKGLKTLAGETNSKLNSSNKLGYKQKERSDELNEFYCRFDTPDFITELAQIRSELQQNYSKRWWMMLKILRLTPREHFSEA